MKHIRYTDINPKSQLVYKYFWNNYLGSGIIKMTYLDLNQLFWEN